MNKLSEIVDNIAAVIACSVMALLCILIFVSILFRWLLNSPVAWQYEATLVGFSWLIFIGMSMTFHTQEHMSLTFVTNALKKEVRVVWLNVIDVLCLAFMVITFICSISVVQSSWPNYYMTIPVPRGLFYLSYPIGAVFSIVHLITNILNRNVYNVSGNSGDEEALTETSTAKGV